MGKRKVSGTKEGTSEVSGGSASEWEDEESLPAKKAKMTKNGNKGTQKATSKTGIPGGIQVLTTGDGEKFVDLGKARRATVRSFKGVKYLDIREFYEDRSSPGIFKPGKKGINLTEDQWKVLKQASHVLDSLLADLET